MSLLPMPTHALLRLLLPPLFLTFALPGSIAAVAADKPRKEGSFGTAKASGAYLTKEQLRSCLKQQSSHGRRDAELQQEKSSLDAARRELVARGDELKSRLESLDRTDAEAVGAHNEQSQSRDRQVDELEARVTAFNARVETARGEREGFVRDCGNRRYFEEDEIAIRKGK